MTSSINTNNHSPGLQFQAGTCRSIGYKSVDSCVIQNTMLGRVQNFEHKNTAYKNGKSTSQCHEKTQENWT
jgi:hypothetical protein